MTPSLLFVPGLGLGPEAWAPTLRHLPPTWSAEVVPITGYGVRGGDDLRPEALGARMAGDLVERPGPPVVLAGHSASAQVVVHAARLAPRGTVAGLVLVGPTTAPALSTWPRLAASWLATARHEDPRQVPALVRQYARTGLVTMARAMDAARRDRADRALAGTGCPVLVLRGRHDRICTRTWADALVAVSPARVRATTLPAGAHMVPLTHGPLVAGEVARFVRAEATQV
jgi:pimeloyl-ACP methyl ester carboxylesterase